MPTPPPKKDEASKTPKAKPEDKTKQEEEHDEEILDDALDDTFPASDPIAPQDPGRPGRD